MTPPLSDAAAARFARALRDGRPRPRRPVAWMVLTLASAGALVALFVWRGQPSPPATRAEFTPPMARIQPMRTAQGLVFAASAQKERLAFADGSRVTLASATRVVVSRAAGHGVDLKLAEGEGVFDVHHHRDTDWRVHVGPFEVQVTGTRFTLNWNAETLTMRLQMQDGTVWVRGAAAGAGVPLTGGQILTANARSGDMRIYRETDPSAPTGTTTDTNEYMAATPATEPLAQPEPQVSPPPPANAERPAVAAVDHVDALLARADEARFAGRTADAIRLLESVAQRATSSSMRAQAAYTLGVLREGQGDTQVAARWFETSLGVDATGPHAALARGRLMRLLWLTGERDRARTQAGAYLAQDAHGPYAEMAREILDATP